MKHRDIRSFVLLIWFSYFVWCPGVGAAVDTETLTELTSSQIQITRTGTSTDRRTRITTDRYALTNVSGEALTGPFTIAVSITPENVTEVLNRSDVSEAGQAILVLDETMLATDASLSYSLQFANPGRSRFTYSQTVFAPTAERDITPPLLSITSPQNGALLTSSEVLVTGTVSDDTGVSGVTVNGVEASIDGEQFSLTLTLQNGINVLTAIATDTSDNTAQVQVTVTLEENDDSIVITGVVEKGPFNTLELSALVYNESQASWQHHTDAVTNADRFSVAVPKQTPVLLQATGEFTNEMTGERVVVTEPLEAIVLAGQEDMAANVNIGTHFVAKRAQQTLANGTDSAPASALEEANTFVNSALGMPSNNAFTALSMQNIPQDADIQNPNLQLLLLSAAVSEITSTETFSTFQALSQDFARAATRSQASEVLNRLQGYQAPYLYEAVVNQGVIIELPPLELGGGVFYCQTLSCEWITVPSPTVYVSSASVYEARGEVVITVRLGQTSSQNVLVDVVSTDLSALSNTDYLPIDEQIEIEAGAWSATVTLPLVIDGETEGDEQFSVAIESQTPSYATDSNDAIVTIKDGAPTLAPPATLPFISEFCLRGVGLPSQPVNDACANQQDALHFVDTAERNAAFLQLDLACSGPSCAQSTDQLVSFYLVALDSTGDVTEEVFVAQHQYLAADIQSNDAAAVASGLILALDARDVTDTFARSVQFGRRLQLEARLPGQPFAGNVAPLSPLLPAPPTLSAGDWTFPIDAISGVTALASDGCNDGDYSLEMQVQLYVGDDFPDQITPPVSANVCVNIDVSPQGDTSAVLTGGEIALAQTVLDLPDGHAMFIERNNLIRPIAWPVFTFLGNESGEERYWLQAEGLPVMFLIGEGKVTPEGITLTYLDTRHPSFAQYTNADPRSTQRPAANDAMFTHIAGHSGNLQFTPRGVNAQLSLSAGGAETAFPLGTLAWQANIQRIEGSKLLPSAVEASFGLAQSSTCRSAGCEPGESLVYQTDNTTLRIDARGFGHGVASVLSTDVPAWGAHGNGHAFARPEDTLGITTPDLMLGGFLFPDTDLPISDYLLGHVEATEQANHILHPRGSQEAVDGNYVPLGLVFGPEIYVSPQGVPVANQGQNLAGKTLAVDNQINTFNITSSLATKYVVRNGGITGVFNASAVPDEFPLYGYNFKLSRFAVRLVDNDMDPFTWIDGNIHVPEHADIDVFFANLSVGCDGKFGKGQVVYELCDGVDNNGNGSTDENCQHQLASWRADAPVFDLSFVGSGGQPALACTAQNQLLELQHQMAMLALDQPISLQGTWDPQGNLVQQALAFPQDTHMDRITGTETGFPISATNSNAVLGVTALSSPEEFSYGWMEITSAQLGVPFWNALDTDVRVANTQGDVGFVAEPTLVLAKAALSKMAQSDRERLNQEILLDLPEATDTDLKALYQWGNSSFAFDFPVYYDPHQFNNGTYPSRFLGIEQAQDLFVIEAKAGINFIEPQRTKLSFGASADFTRLQQVRFQVDLDDPSNLEDVDSLLVSLGILDKPLLYPTFSETQEKIQIINRYANKGLDELMRQGLEQGLKQVGNASAPLTPNGKDPFVTASESLAYLKSLPDQVGALLDAEVKGRLDRELDAAEAGIRQQLHAFENEFIAIADISPVEQDVLGRIDEIQALVRMVRDRATETGNQFIQPLNQTQDLIAQINQTTSDLDEAVTQIQSVASEVTDVVEQQCNSTNTLAGEANGYVDQMVINITAMKEFLSLLQGSEFLMPIAELVTEDPETRQQVAQAQQDIQRQAEALLDQVAEAEQAVKDQVCTTDNQLLLAEVNQMLSSLRAQTNALNNQIAFLNDQVKQLTSELRIALTRLLTPLSEADTALTRVRGFVTRSANAVSGTRLIAFAESQLNDVTGGSINALVADPSQPQEKDIVTFAIGEPRAQLNREYQNLRYTLVSEFRDRLPGAYYTPEQLRKLVVSLIMSSPPVASLRTEMNRHFVEIKRQINDLSQQITNPVNELVKDAVASVESDVNEALEDALAEVRELPLQAANVDGYATIAANELERLHVNADWTMGPEEEGEDGTKFKAALEVVNWKANNKAAGCGVPQGESRFDVTLSTYNLAAEIQETEINVEELSMGFTLGTSQKAPIVPLGVFGMIITEGEIELEEFTIINPGFAAGIGAQETYLGANAEALFSEVQAEMALLLGRTCNQDLLKSLDPKVGDFIQLPPNGFAGVYARGGASVPVIANGCPLTVGVSANFGAWLLAGPPTTIGGLIGGGAYGKVACIGALRGQLRALGQVNTDGDILFSGGGFGAAGLGLCEPENWTSVERSRNDDFCGTGDAQFEVRYENGWSVTNLSINGIF